MSASHVQVRGSKHWKSLALSSLWSWLIPVLKVTFADVTHDSVRDWCSCIRYCVYDRDPRRFYQLTDMLFEPDLTLDEADTSFAQYVTFGSSDDSSGLFLAACL